MLYICKYVKQVSKIKETLILISLYINIIHTYNYKLIADFLNLISHIFSELAQLTYSDFTKVAGIEILYYLYYFLLI